MTHIACTHTHAHSTHTYSHSQAGPHHILPDTPGGSQEFLEAEGDNDSDEEAIVHGEFTPPDRARKIRRIALSEDKEDSEEL
jgi:hypothetical protein